MHTVEKLDFALTALRRLGYRIRDEHLDGVTGGPCQIGGAKWLFLDLALSPHERLQAALRALRQEGAAAPWMARGGSQELDAGEVPDSAAA